MFTNSNPINLTGLRQAAYVLNNLAEGKSSEQVVKNFQGDRQLVQMWTSFLIHNQWIQTTVLGEYSVTQKGKDWIGRLEKNKSK